MIQQEESGSGDMIWTDLVTFVLSNPNGYEMAQTHRPLWMRV